jgi:hypothetical protein
VILLLSTNPQGRGVDTHFQKPNIVEVHNKIKGLGQNKPWTKFVTYIAAQERQPFCVFNELLNMAGVNAIFTFNSVMSAKGIRAIPRRKLLKLLSENIYSLDSKEVSNAKSTFWCEEPHLRDSGRQRMTLSSRKSPYFSFGPTT